MAKRQVFFSFHYAPDNWRVSQVRNVGQIEDNKSLSDNKWEEVKKKGQEAIQDWIDENLKYRSCTVILVGEDTAKRKWIDYEIEKSWNDGKGLVGIHIHNLKNSKSEQSNKGTNPFEHFNLGDSIKLSSIVKCYNPPYSISTNVYNHIKDNLEDWVEEAIKIRNKH